MSLDSLHLRSNEPDPRNVDDASTAPFRTDQNPPFVYLIHPMSLGRAALNSHGVQVDAAQDTKAVYDLCCFGVRIVQFRMMRIFTLKTYFYLLAAHLSSICREKLCQIPRCTYPFLQVCTP
jgi:hypothetical protein